jgi:hypothetical protein
MRRAIELHREKRRVGAIGDNEIEVRLERKLVILRRDSTPVDRENVGDPDLRVNLSAPFVAHLSQAEVRRLFVKV